MNPFARQGFDRAIGGVVEVVEQVGGMNAQTPRGPSVGLWGRVRGFRQDELDGLLRSYELVKANLLRGTVHLVTRRQYVAWRLALQPALERAVRQFCPRLWDHVDHDVLLREGRALLADHDGLTRAELTARLGPRFRSRRTASSSGSRCGCWRRWCRSPIRRCGIRGVRGTSWPSR